MTTSPLDHGDPALGQGAGATAGALEGLLVDVPCPVCGSRESDVVKEARYPADLPREEIVEIFRSSSDAKLMDALVACRGCGHLFLSPRLDESVILDSYSGGEDPRFAAQNPLRIRTFKRTFEAWARRQGVAADGSVRVLDVGCAAGAFPRAAHELGFPVVGVEPSHYLSAYARDTYGLDIRTGILEDQGFTDAAFQVITLWDVIEHLSDPARTLRDIGRVLDPSGYLVVNYPDVETLPCRLMGERWPFYLSVHLSYFTRKSISRLLRDNGFEPLRFERHYQTLELGYLLERAGEYIPLFGRLGKWIEAIGLGRIPMTYYMGQILVTARKR